MNSGIPHTCVFETAASTLKMKTKVSANWFSTQVESALAEKIRRTLVPKGFRQGPAADAELRRRLLPSLRNDLVTQIIEPPIADYALNNGLVVFVPGDVEVSSWEGPKDIDITVSVPVWTPIGIDLEKFIAALKTKKADGSSPESWHAAVISSLRETHRIELDKETIARYAAITGVRLGASAASDEEFKSKLTDTLLIDSLAVALKIKITEADEKKRIAKLASETGLSVLEISDRINQIGGLAVFRREIRRELALEESKRRAA